MSTSKIKVEVVLEFDLLNTTGIDSTCDAEYFARDFICEHIMDDEEFCPIKMTFFFKENLE